MQTTVVTRAFTFDTAGMIMNYLSFFLRVTVQVIIKSKWQRFGLVSRIIFFFRMCVPNINSYQIPPKNQIQICRMMKDK